MQAPIEFRYVGDRDEGIALRGQALRAMRILENLMSFRGLSQDSITVIPYSGATIYAQKFFGKRIITITTGAEEQIINSPNEYCLCNCNFTFGYIDAINEKTFEEIDCWTEVDESEKITLLYDILICLGKRVYKRYTDILASDFTEYKVGEKIMLVPYNGALFTCCTSIFNATGCVPVMQENEVGISDEEWLSVARIIPWCGEKVRKFYQR